MMKASLQTSDQKDIQINYLQQQLLSTRQVNIFLSIFYSHIFCLTLKKHFFFLLKYILYIYSLYSNRIKEGFFLFASSV